MIIYRLCIILEINITLMRNYMNLITYPLLTSSRKLTEQCTLHFMKMAELQDACRILGLPDAGKKAELIEKIMVFIRTGTIMPLPKIPEISRASLRQAQRLHPDALMLYGSYKNDAATRAFFKTLIGPRFHYTAFGIDWLNWNRSMANRPPIKNLLTIGLQNQNGAKKIPKIPKKNGATLTSCKICKSLIQLHPKMK